MDLTKYLQNLRNDLITAASVGDENARNAAAMLAGALEPAARLAIMNALSDLAAEVTGALGDTTVELRLDGRDVRVAVTRHAEDTASSSRQDDSYFTKRTNDARNESSDTTTGDASADDLRHAVQDAGGELSADHRATVQRTEDAGGACGLGAGRLAQHLHLQGRLRFRALGGPRRQAGLARTGVRRAARHRVHPRLSSGAAPGRFSCRVRNPFSTDEETDMHTFLTPEPITVEIRNASGEIRVDLADVASTTVDVVASTSHPLASSTTSSAPPNRSSATRPSPAVAGSTRPLTPEAQTSPTIRSSGSGWTWRDAVDGQAGTLIVDTDPARNGWKSSFTVHVTAPLNSGIRIQSQSADVSVTGRAERLEARTASGEVRVDDVTGHSVVQTASGDIQVRSSGSCDLRSASGEIRARAVTGEAVAHSTSGDVELDATGGNVNARTVSGEIRVLDLTAGRVELTTVSGDVEIGLHTGSLAAVDLSTVSGRTDTDLPVSDAAPAEQDDDAPRLELKVKTTSGDIRIRRATTV